MICAPTLSLGFKISEKSSKEGATHDGPKKSAGETSPAQQQNPPSLLDPGARNHRCQCRQRRRRNLSILSGWRSIRLLVALGSFANHHQPRRVSGDGRANGGCHRKRSRRSDSRRVRREDHFLRYGDSARCELRNDRFRIRRNFRRSGDFRAGMVCEFSSSFHSANFSHDAPNFAESGLGERHSSHCRRCDERFDGVAVSHERNIQKSRANSARRLSCVSRLHRVRCHGAAPLG